MRTKSAVRRRVRAAVQIHQQFIMEEITTNTPQLPVLEWERFHRLLRHWEFLRSRQWRRGLQRLAYQSERLTNQIRGQLRDLHTELEAAARGSAIPTLRDIDDDLRALRDEFADVQIDLQKKTLTVTTDDIELEEVPLGPFAIVLDWQRLREHGPYTVRALDPYPAGGESGSSRHTHPHIHDDRLCEGEGRVPIRHALAQGRLFDFFLLVRQILETYNPHSAYVSLEQWHARSCRDCGSLTADDDLTLCDRCETEICHECGQDCRRCQGTCCGDCLETCAACGTSGICPGCLTACADCDAECCDSCLVEGRCENCTSEECSEDAATEHEEFDEHEELEPTSPHPRAANSPTDAPVHPVCVGEASVPA